MMEMTDKALLASFFINNTNKNVFLTGKAGTGKTTLLKYIIETTHKKALVTAPTGIAALNAKGVTLHSQFQLPFAAFLPQQSAAIGSGFIKFETRASIAKNMHMSEIKRSAIRACELLIIDEVSMLRSDTLDAIDTVLQLVRKNRQPFGGIQVLFIGDLLQLPPVVKNEEWAVLKNHYNSAFFFDAHVLRDSPPLFIELDKIFRQSDRVFTDLLNNLRYNKITKADVELLNKYVKPSFKPKPEEGYITLTTHNRFADTINQQELAALKTETKTFDATLTGEFPEHVSPCDRELVLKVDAQVMFIKNDTSGENRYYNGKIGRIKSFKDGIQIEVDDQPEWITVDAYTWKHIRYTVDEASKELKEEELGSFEQYPLRLAWAITIHKSQGLTFDKAIIDVQNVFASGQAYVALSRLRSIEGLVLSSPFPQNGIDNDRAVSRFEEEITTQPEPITLQQRESYAYLRQTAYLAFDFEPLIKHFTAHILSYDKEENQSEKQKHIDWIQEVTQKLSPLTDVGQKFLSQLDAIYAEDNYELLEERLVAARSYFEKFLQEAVVSVLKKLRELESKKRIKAYQTELLELDDLIMKKVDALYKVVAIAKNFKSALPLTRDQLNKKAINEWRSGLIETVKIAHATKAKSTKSEPGEKKKKKEKGDTYKVTLALHKAGKTTEEIAAERELTVSTIQGHFLKLATEKELKVEAVLPADTLNALSKVVAKNEEKSASELFSLLKGAYGYSELRLAMLHHKIQTENTAKTS